MKGELSTGIGFPAISEAHTAGHMMEWGYGMGWWAWVLMLLFWLAIIALLAVALRWVISSGHGKRRQERIETALDILNKRYAGGEITKEEYEKIKSDIK